MPNQGGLPVSVADVRSDRMGHVMDAVEVLGRSDQRLEVFKAIYYHKQRVKTVQEIADRTGLSRMRVLQIGGHLYQKQIVGQTEKDGDTAYSQDRFYQTHKAQILRLIGNPVKQEKVATKRSPKVTVKVQVKNGRARAKAPKFVTLDTIDSFSKARRARPANAVGSMSEDDFKAGVQNILGERGRFKDWPGEQNDIFTTELVVGGRRRRAAFAFKGPGYKGILRPKHMGVNGDQIQRLFKSPADVFIVQHHTQIGEQVFEQMETYARLRASDTNGDVFYGTIDGKDSNRLIAAYPKAFGFGNRPATRS